MASAPVDRHICSKHCEKVSKSELINLLSKALSSVTTYKSTEEETKILKLRQHSKDSLSEARLLFADPEIKCNCFYELDGFLSDLSDHEIDDEEFQDIIDYEQDNDNLREQFYNTSSEDLAKELKRNENLISKYCNQEVVKGINIESLAYDNVIKMWTWRDDMADTNTEELTESESSSAQTPDEKCWEQEDTQTVNTTKGKDTAKKEQTSLHSLESLKASDNSIIDISQEPINLSLSQALPEDQTVPDQSINATPDSELYVSQPTPVKKIVSSTQQVITPLDTYLNGLCSSGASFPDSQEAERIKCDVEKMAQSVHKQLADSFTLFSGSSLIKSGSTYEGLKVGEPDEFDFMFYLPLLSDEMIVEVYSPFDTSMFSNYEIQDYSLFRDILMHRELEANSTQITEANFSYEVFLKLKQILKESLQSALLPRWSCVYMPRITKCTAPEKIVAYTFYLTYKGVQFSNLKIGLDFTLCFTKVRDLTLPFREDEINSRLDPEYRGKRHFIIINDKKARQSFSLHEKAILGSYDVDSAQKRCLRVVKYLRDKHLPKIFDHFTETMGSFIPTYWLKVIAFYHFDDKSVQWNPEQLSNNVISIFQTLYQCFTRSLLRDYFFRSDNLMEGWDKHKRLCFKRHVQDKTDEEIGRFGFLSDDCEIYIKIVKALNDLLELLYQVNSGEVEADCIMEAEQQWKTVNDRTYKQELKKWADTYRELLLEEESTVNKVTDRNGHHLNLPAQFQRTEKATDGKGNFVLFISTQWNNQLNNLLNYLST